MSVRQIAVILIAAFFLSCGGHSENAGQIGARIHLKEKGVPFRISVQVIVPVQGPLQEKVTIYGKLSPVRETLLSSQFPGRISRLSFSEGDRVQAKQLVAAVLSPKAEALRQADSNSPGTEMLPIAVRSPFSGIISQKFHFVGDVISPGEPIVKIQDTSQFFLWGQLPAIYLNRVKPGQTIQVSFPDVPGLHLQSKIEAINAAVNSESQTAKIRATLKNKNHLLKKNMLATIHIVTRAVQRGLLLPRKAVLRDTKGDFVFLKMNGKAHRQAVGIGLQTLDTLEIRSGLAPTDSVILTGNYELKEGMSVQALGKGN